MYVIKKTKNLTDKKILNEDIHTHIPTLWGERAKEFDDSRKIQNGVPNLVSRDKELD